MSEDTFKADCLALLRALYPNATAYRLCSGADGYKLSVLDGYGRAVMASSGPLPVWEGMRAFLLEEVVRLPRARYWRTIVGTPEGRLLDLSSGGSN